MLKLGVRGGIAGGGVGGVRIENNQAVFTARLFFFSLVIIYLDSPTAGRRQAVVQQPRF